MTPEVLAAFQYIRGVPVVNTDTSPYLWVLLDTGCNSSLMTVPFAAKAEERLSDFNLGLFWAHRESRSYGGSGGAETARQIGAITWPSLIAAGDLQSG